MKVLVAESAKSATLVAALRSRTVGDGERSGLQIHHRGTPGARQRRPERPRRLLQPAPAQGDPANHQTPSAGESAAGAPGREETVERLSAGS